MTADNFDEIAEKKIIKEFSSNINYVREKLKEDTDLATYLPEHLLPYKDAIAKVRGSPYSAFFLNTIIALAAVLPYSSTSFLGEKFTGFSPMERRLLNTIGLLPAGFTRIVQGVLTHWGYGEAAATIIQTMGVLGTASIISVLYQYDDNDFANATTNSDLYYIIMLCNIFISLPLGCYPKIAEIARQSPKNAETREKTLSDIAEVTGVSMDLSWWQKKITHILGQGPVRNIALASAIANIGPGITNAIPLIIPDSTTTDYFVVLGLQLALLIGSRTYPSSPYQVQLKQHKVPEDTAFEITEYLGQEPKLPASFLPNLSTEEQIAAVVSIIDVSVFYVAFYSLLVLICLSGKGIYQEEMGPTIATLIVISIAVISSFSRAIPAYSLFGLTASQFNLAALAVMTATSLIVTLSPENGIWALLLFAVANGCGNGVVINKLTEDAPKYVAAGTALSTGIALILAFPFGLAETSFHEIILLICAATLAYGIAREAGWKPHSALQKFSILNSNRPTQQIEMPPTFHPTEHNDDDEKKVDIEENAPKM